MNKEWIDRLEIAARIALLVFSLTIGMIVIMAGAKAALAANLRPETIISGDYIKLGDIFDGVENADYVLGPAPQPGKDMILNARTLYKIASSLDVDWKPASSAEQIILRREAVIIPQDDITSALEEKIREKGVDETFSVSYMTQPSEMILPAGTAGEFEITAFNFDVQKDSFNASIVAPSAENPLKRTNVSGRIERLVAIPVLKNSLKSGDIISAHDLDWIELPQGKIASGFILNEKDLINMTPRRTISGGKPVQANDLEHPKMVDRGDSVTLVFDNGIMYLTTKGKALQAGAMGDMVRVSNSDSNKNLQGEITGHREVTIR